MQQKHRGRTSASDIAMDRIKNYILTNELQPGDAVPTEATLCEELGISRSSVREAIRTLSALDIIEVRHGIGTFVGGLSLRPLVEGMVFRGVLSPGSKLDALREVVEVRTALDLSVAESVVKLLQDEPAEDLFNIVETMEEKAAANESFADQDRAFHSLLAAKLNNSLLEQLVAAFWDIHTAVLPQLNVSEPSDIEKTICAHREMLEAAQAGEIDRYRAAVITHYTPLHNALNQATGKED